MYTPSKTLLNKYAKVLINFALNSGKGVRPDEVVYVVTQVPGIPLAREVYREILARGAHPLLNIIEDDVKRVHIENGSAEQIRFFPRPFYRGLEKSIDHWVRIMADRDPMYLRGCDPRKVLLYQRSTKVFREWLDKKEDTGKFTWTLCLYGTGGLAAEAGLSERQYWSQIQRACFLDRPDPVTTWKKVYRRMNGIIGALSAMPVDRLHVQAHGTDLWLTLGEKRKWLGGSGRNIPSFEIFTSPDWRGTSGHITFDLPLYRYGTIIKDIRLVFKNGIITRATARKNEHVLRELVRQKNADKIGEFSLTDKRFSRITRFMADSLYDENFGGRHGNTHLAIGRAYHDTCTEDAAKMTRKDFDRLGFNHSAEHTDIIATTDRTVTAVLKDGRERVIFRNGSFCL